MHPLVRAAAAAAALALVGSWGSARPADRSARAAPADVQAAAAAAAAPGSAQVARQDPAPQQAPDATAPAGGRPSELGAAPRCAPRTLPAAAPGERSASCVPLPSPSSALRAARARRLASRPADLGTAQIKADDDALGLIPNRTEQWAAYALPVQTDLPVIPASSAAAEGAGASWGPEPAGGVLIETTEDAPVELVQLENQRESAQVVLVGALHGVTVVTRHDVDGPGGPKAYLLIHGLLSRPGPAVVSGARLEPGAVVGFVGDDEGTRLPQLYFEVRQLRGAQLGVARQLSDLVSPAASIACDPRNVLQLR